MVGFNNSLASSISLFLYYTKMPRANGSYVGTDYHKCQGFPILIDYSIQWFMKGDFT